MLLAGCRTPQSRSTDEVPVEPADTGKVTEAAVEEAAPESSQPEIQERNKIMVLLKTSKGDIKLALDPEKAPETVENFLSYVEAGHYDGTIFHRVIDGFMIQGGGFEPSMRQKPAPRTVKNEAANGLQNVVGTIAMARTQAPHSASAQFFINVADNNNLDYPSFDGWGYCVFGEVVEGMDVVNTIKGVPTRTVGPHQNVPAEPIVIESATRI
jgi:cyclophilin family peptidyl-prolyl cis-trans isomerase